MVNMESSLLFSWLQYLFVHEAIMIFIHLVFFLLKVKLYLAKLFILTSIYAAFFPI